MNRLGKAEKLKVALSAFYSRPVKTCFSNINRFGREKKQKNAFASNCATWYFYSIRLSVFRCLKIRILLKICSCYQIFSYQNLVICLFFSVFSFCLCWSLCSCFLFFQFLLFYQSLHFTVRLFILEQTVSKSNQKVISADVLNTYSCAFTHTRTRTS